MKAFALEQSNETTTLIEIEPALPSPGENEVVIAVAAAGVTPTELLWYPSTHQKDGSVRKQAIPGHEFSGVVSAVGKGVIGFKVGDEIFGMNDWFAQGATAEQCVTSETQIALKPATISHAAAAAAPIAALTAWQGLIDRAAVKAGERVLIVGAAGAVGLMAVQIAAMRGCHVIASASAEDASMLACLGCEQVLDYHSVRFEDHLRNIDVVFDAVGSDTLARAMKTLNPQGRLVTIAADAEGNDDPAIKQAFFIVEPSGAQLKHVAELIENGNLRVFVKAILPFTEAPDAYLKRCDAPGPGKLVLDLHA